MLNFILPPIIGGIIGLSTNWLAIKMLFRPHSPKYIFGKKLPLTPGLIPQEQARIAKKMAEAISTRLLTPETLAVELANPALWPLPDITVGEALSALGIDQESSGFHLNNIAEKLLPMALDKLDQPISPEFDAKLQELIFAIIDENVSGLAKMFISKDKIYASIKDNIKTYLRDEGNHPTILEQIRRGIEHIIASGTQFMDINIRNAFTKTWEEKAGNLLHIAATYIAQNIPIEAMIENKLSNFDAEEAEKIILTVAGRELTLIIWLGGILGFILGGVMIII